MHRENKSTEGAAQISAKNTTERPKTSNPAVPNESRDRRDSDCTQKQSGKAVISKKAKKRAKEI